MRGKDKNSVRQKVIITHPYWLGACEVTQAQWSAIMPDNPSEFKGSGHPVDNIGWDAASEFCKRLTAREQAAGRLPKDYIYALPSECEWEYAARAGCDDDMAPIPGSGWCAINSGGVDADSGIWRMGTHPVAQKQPNTWGFYDMAGNIAEWCADWFAEYPAGDVTDPRGPEQGAHRALRGGCWWADAQNCRPASRHKAPPARHHSGLGLRIALRRSVQ
jgi:formylglycine-generating enzyme required for sulfatase activity